MAVGTFDGVHRGHQRILASLNEVALQEGLKQVAYAFSFPPRLTLLGERRGLILPEEVKKRLLERYVDRVERASFPDVSVIPPDVFVRDVLLDRLAARAVVVGENFRFGRDRAGDLALLRAMCEERSATVVAVPPVVIDGSAVSSTRIRALIAEGKIEDASVLLGRTPLLVGQVVHGDRLGKELGYPTANLSIDTRILLPKDGIYLVHAFWDTGRSPGLLYVGTRPTVSGTDRRCEVHLFTEADHSGADGPVISEDLYGKVLEVHLRHRLRDDRSFPSLIALRRQMEHDVAHARRVLSSSDWPEEPIVT